MKDSKTPKLAVKIKNNKLFCSSLWVEAEYRTFMWDGRDDMSRMASAGMYIAVMKANNFIDSRKMVLLK